MNIVVDTNVLMSGIFFGGVPGRIVNAWSVGRLQMVLSTEILDEYRRVGADLAARYPARAIALGPVLALVAMHATVVHAPPLAAPASADAADDMFLAAAIASATPLIVSGDAHLLDVSGWRGVTVLTPRAFVDRYLRVT